MTLQTVVYTFKVGTDHGNRLPHQLHDSYSFSHPLDGFFQEALCLEESQGKHT